MEVVDGAVLVELTGTEPSEDGFLFPERDGRMAKATALVIPPPTAQGQASLLV